MLFWIVCTETGEICEAPLNILVNLLMQGDDIVNYTHALVPAGKYYQNIDNDKSEDIALEFSYNNWVATAPHNN